jgi:hypothetical protein
VDLTCHCAVDDDAWAFLLPLPLFPRSSGGERARLRSCRSPLHRHTTRGRNSPPKRRGFGNPSRSRRHRQLSQASAQLVQSYSHVQVEVRVHAQNYPGYGGRAPSATHHHVHRSPFGVAVTSGPTTRRTDEYCEGPFRRQAPMRSRSSLGRLQDGAEDRPTGRSEGIFGPVLW